MSEPGKPLSRRERRAREEAARAAEGEVTQALPVAPGETISIMSRRERRRLERLEHPMETWTAEEEMIATGQMPAMTPEVIAEQERLAREKAAQADAEARAAAAPAEPVGAEPVGAEASAEPVGAEPVSAEAPTEPVGETKVGAVAPTDPVGTGPVSAGPVSAGPVASGGIPADLRHLFPPGSLQARAFETAPAEPAAPPAAADAADEIRRLTQEAMAGISRATTGSTPLATEPTAQEEPTPDADPVPSMPEGVDVEELWNAPTVDEPVREPVGAAHGEDQEPEPVRLDEVPLVRDIPVPHEPEHTGTETSVPVWSALVPVSPAPQTAITPAQQPAPSVWDTHPLTRPGATPVRELPAEPTPQSLPRPDLSALLNTQANPTVGQQQTELRSTEPLTSTGAMPQRIPVPPAAGGARHFRWAHLAIIGAIAFVLGVVAWNIAGSGS